MKIFQKKCGRPGEVAGAENSDTCWQGCRGRGVNMGIYLWMYFMDGPLVVAYNAWQQIIYLFLQ